MKSWFLQKLRQFPQRLVSPRPLGPQERPIYYSDFPDSSIAKSRRRATLSERQAYKSRSAIQKHNMWSIPSIWKACRWSGSASNMDFGPFSSGLRWSFYWANPRSPLFLQIRLSKNNLASWELWDVADNKLSARHESCSANILRRTGSPDSPIEKWQQAMSSRYPRIYNSLDTYARYLGLYVYKVF